MSQESFHARLNRIGADKPLEALAESTPTAERTLDHTSRGILLDLVMVPIAFLSGLGSVIFAIWVQFHYVTDQGEFGLSGGEFAGGFLGDLVIAIVVSLALKEILNLKSPARSFAEITGFVFGFFGLHILVEMMPTMFANLFSAQWVLYSLDYL